MSATPDEIREAVGHGQALAVRRILDALRKAAKDDRAEKDGYEGPTSWEGMRLSHRYLDLRLKVAMWDEFERIAKSYRVDAAATT